MSTTVIDGGPAGPDEAAGQYRNRILTDRAVWWEAAGSRQGVKRGFVLSTIGGQMALSASAGLGFVEERDTSGNAGATGRGYAVWTDSAQTVSFDPASAANRNDAVVLAFVDVSVGVAAVGTETTVVGGQLVVVPGTSGVTTPRTDSDISAAVGSGGWVRLADVLIESTDTEIQAGNIDTATDGYLPGQQVRTVSGTISGSSIPAGTATAETFNFGFTLPASPQLITGIVTGFVSGASGVVIRTIDQYSPTSCRVAVVNTGESDATFSNLPVSLLVLV